MVFAKGKFFVNLTNFFFVFNWQIYIPKNTNAQDANCFILNVSPKKNQPKKTAATGNKNKNGENLLAGKVHIAKLYRA